MSEEWRTNSIMGFSGTYHLSEPLRLAQYDKPITEIQTRPGEGSGSRREGLQKLDLSLCGC